MTVLARIEEGQQLNEMQRAFVDCLLTGGSNSDAMAAAGYADSLHWSQILRSEAVQAALKAGRKAIIRGELGTDALKAMRDLLKPETPAATRFNAAKWVLEHDADAADGEKPLAEMTPSELEAFIQRASASINEAKDARMIDVTPDNGAQR